MIFLSFLFTNVFCWWGHSHMIIAEIATRLLETKEIKKIEYLINSPTLPSQSTIVNCASWQDDLKSSGFSGMGNWHFTDIPFLLNVTNPSKITIQPDTYTVVDYLESAYEILSLKTTTDLWSLGFHLRSIIHFVGDIHTPHHCVQMYSDAIPAGDIGGNRYYLNCEYGSACNNIHFFWDSAALTFPLSDPLSSINYETFTNNATLLMNKFPQDYYHDYDLKTFQPSLWANESNHYAQIYGYSTPMNKRPSDDYFETAQFRAQERIALAGYRLGYLLKDLINHLEFDYNDASQLPVSEIVVWVFNALLFVGIVIVFVINLVMKKKYLITN